jgi:hypothetical protein
MKFTSLSLAVALANIVLPVPGGPYKITPLLNLAPIYLNLDGVFRYSII